MRSISQRELRNDSADVLRQVEAGESLVITRRGTPVAKLVPLADAAAPVRSARRPVQFAMDELVVSSVNSAELLAELRTER